MKVIRAGLHFPSTSIISDFMSEVSVIDDTCTNIFAEGGEVNAAYMVGAASSAARNVLKWWRSFWEDDSHSTSRKNTAGVAERTWSWIFCIQLYHERHAEIRQRRKLANADQRWLLTLLNTTEFNQQGWTGCGWWTFTSYLGGKVPKYRSKEIINLFKYAALRCLATIDTWPTLQSSRPSSPGCVRS